MRNTIRMMLVSALLGSGCYADELTPVNAVTGDGTAELVEISPGVEVVADYGTPIFFADDLYWWFDGGIWYSSSWYGGGWTRAGFVSPRVAGIVHPERYAHYRPEGWAPRGRGAGPAEARTVQGVAPVRASGGVTVRSRHAPRGGGRGRR